MKKYNVVIVEDHPFTRQTLSYEIKKEDSLLLMNVFENGKDVVDFVKINTPDIILMDIEMPVMDGIAATKEIKQFNDNIKIIMLTSHVEREKVFDAFSSGANAYCVKKIKMEELLRVIDIVINDGIWFDTQIANYIFDILKNLEVNQQKEEVKKTLEDFNITPRERNILKLIADGKSNAEIAEILIISHNTVKNHVASIINKFSLKDRTQVALFTIKNNLL